MTWDEDQSDLDMDREEFVPAVFARNEREADMYRELLEDHDIEALVGYDELEKRDDAEGSVEKQGYGLPVLVPETVLDEASEIIADREDIEEFEALEDTEEEDEEQEDEFEVDPAMAIMDDEEEEDLFLDNESDEEELFEDEDDLYDEDDDEDEDL